MNNEITAITDFLFVENQPQKADIILVLGGSRPQLMEKACTLFNEGWANYILPSGGKNNSLPEYDTEWDYFLEISKKYNIPEEKIIKEDKAKNTFENARFSKRVLEEKGLEITKAILVCKAFHARRALLTYRTEFNKNIEYFVCPIIDERNITRDNWYLDQDKIERTMSEVERIGKYFAAHISEIL